MNHYLYLREDENDNKDNVPDFALKQDYLVTN